MCLQIMSALRRRVQFQRAIRTSFLPAFSRRGKIRLDDMGGESNVSIQQRTLIDIAAKQKLLLDSFDAWLLTRSIIDKPKNALIPVVQQRQQIADSLARYLGQLGLERRSKIKTLRDLLADEENDSPCSDPD